MPLYFARHSSDGGWLLLTFPWIEMHVTLDHAAEDALVDERRRREGFRAGWAAVRNVSVWFVLLTIVLASLAGCYSHRIAMVGPEDGTPPPATEPTATVAWSLLWGAVVKEPVPDNCQGQPLAEVQASSNFAFDLLTVATLGAVAPLRLSWRCARPMPATGEFPVPPEN